MGTAVGLASATFCPLLMILTLQWMRRLPAPKKSRSFSAYQMHNASALPSPRFEMLSFCVLFELFVENDRHLTGLTAGHKRICFVRFLKRKSVCNEVFRMNLPAHNPLHGGSDAPAVRVNLGILGTAGR